jgi:predicted outer membrane repeat protein
MFSAQGIWGITYNVTAGDVASLQSQFNLLQTGDELYIPNGTYTIPDTSYHFIFAAKQNVTFRGQSRDGTIIDLNNNVGIHIYAGEAIFKNLTIQNATNSALYCEPDGQTGVNSVVSVENVLFKDNAGTVGAALRYNFSTPYGAYPISILDCEFVSNIAEQNGGAIYIQSAMSSLTIERNVFRGNSCVGYDGAAIYIADVKSDLTLENNLMYSNSAYSALYFGLVNRSSATGTITLRNNTIAKNSYDGIYSTNNFSNYTIDFDNNIIVDNAYSDVNWNRSFSGDYNVVESLGSGATISGANNTNGVSGDYFNVVSQALVHTALGVDYAFSKLYSNYPTYDVYGKVRDAVASDIGAFEVSLADQGIAYWIETASDNTWTNTANWRRGVLPTSSFSEVYILDCSSGNYPELTTDLDLSSADLDLSSGATFYNPYNLTAKSIYVHSDAAGTGEFLNEGTISGTTSEVYEQYLIPNQWNFLGIADAVTTAGNLLSGQLAHDWAGAGADYWLSYYDGVNRSNFGKDSEANWHQITTDATALDQNKGYIVWVDNAQTVEFSSPSSSTVDVSLAYDVGDRSSNQWGWNLIGNPYSTTLSADAVIANLDNLTNTTSSVNVLNVDQEEYESRAGGNLGDAAYIPSHQAYFVQSTKSGKANMRSSNARFRSGVVFKSSSIDQPNVLIISVSDSVVRDRAFFRLKEECTDDYDNYWDSYKLTSRSSTNLGIRSVLNDIDYDVNSFSIDEGSMKTIPLYLTLPDNLRELTFSFDVEGFEGANLYLRDHRNGTLTEVKHDLQYLITLDDGQLATSLSDQFSLEIRSFSVVTGECSDILTNENIKVYTTTNGLRVLSENKSDAIDVVVYDVLGKAVAYQTLVGGSGTVSGLGRGVYIAKVLQSEVIESHKVIVH